MIDFSGEQLICCSFIDVTEHIKTENALKESEEKFKLIFEKSIAPIVIADDKGYYLEVNKSATELVIYLQPAVLMLHYNMKNILKKVKK